MALRKAAPSWYEVLGVDSSASAPHIRKAFKAQALCWHPDKSDAPDAEEKFKQISMAWEVLSDEARRAAYDASLRRGDDDDDRSYFARQYESADQARRAYEEFMRSEQILREAHQVQERTCIISLLSLLFWLAIALQLVQLHEGPLRPLLFRQPLEICGKDMGSIPFSTDFDGFQSKLRGRSTARLPQALRALEGVSRATGVSLLQTHTPFVRIVLNRSADGIRRAPPAGQTHQRGWLLTTASRGEDIYGRSLDLVTHTYLHMASGAVPSPWPAKVVCVPLLKSGPIKHKHWWTDMSRAVGGRLRPFAFAVRPAADCEPQLSLLALAGSTVLAVVATKLTLRVLLPRRTAAEDRAYGRG